jgi:sarcosine oxidase subunit gamma
VERHRGETAGGNASITIAEKRVQVFQLMARKGKADALRTAVRDALGLALPEPGHWTRAGAWTATWIAPEAWLLAYAGGPGSDAAQSIDNATRGVASLMDQSSGKSVLTIAGPRARDVLAKGCRVDLHRRAFGAGRAAVTPIGHVHGIVAQIDDVPTFDLIVPSTLARDVFEWLCVSAAEFGYRTA